MYGEFNPTGGENEGKMQRCALFHSTAAELEVNRVDASGNYFHQHFARPGFRIRHIFITELVDIPIAMSVLLNMAYID